jgi:hypothetical protein
MCKIYIFCESYIQLENTLCLLERNVKKGHPIVIIVEENLDLFNLFLQLKNDKYKTFLDVVHMEYIRTHGSGLLKRMFHLLRKIYLEKKHLEKIYLQHFKKLRGATIYFFCRPYNPYTFYMLNRLIGNNIICYIHPDAVDFTSFINLPTIKIVNRAKIQWLGYLYGKGIKWIYIPSYGACTYITDCFMSKVHKIISKDKRAEWLNKFSQNNFQFITNNSYSVVYHDTPLQVDEYEKEEYFHFMNNMFAILHKYFTVNEILIKHTPSKVKSGDYELFGRIVPDNIPCQWLHKNNTLLLGFYTACIYNATTGFSVSLEELLVQKNEDIKAKRGKIKLKSASSDILFPKSLEEFEIIVKNHYLSYAKKLATQ